MKKQKITRIKCTYSLLHIIKTLREKNRLNKDEISLQMGKARNYISNLENGKNEYVKINDFRSIVKILLPQITVELTNENLVLIAKAINENHGHIENILIDINNIEILKIDRETLEYELEKQLMYKKYDYDRVERECNLPKDTIYKIVTGERKPIDGESGVNLKFELQMDFIYTSLKTIFGHIGLIKVNQIDTYLNMLGVTVPNVNDVDNLIDINMCYKIDNVLGNMGEYIDRWYSELLKDDRDNHTSVAEFAYNGDDTSTNTHIDNRKQELHNKINQASEILHSIVNKIDSDDYTGTIQYEAIVQTVTELLLTKGGLRVVQDLFQYPLHKLNENDIKSICDVVNDKLDFQYAVVEENKNETNEQLTLFDLLYQHTHLECVSKKSIYDTESTIVPLVHSNKNKKQD